MTEVDLNLIGLVGSWHFNEGSGSNVKDSSGETNHGAISGTSWVTGVESYGGKFDGVNDYVQISSSTDFDASIFTVSFWMKSTGLWGSDGDSGGAEQGTAEIINRHGPVASSSGFAIYQHASSSGRIGMAAKSGDSYSVNMVGTSNLSDNNWHHVVGIYNRASGGTNYLYIDGIEENHTDSIVDWSFNNQDVYIGDSPDAWWEEWNGTIDEVRIYNRSLSGAEINKSFCIGAYRLNHSASQTFTYPSWCDDYIKSYSYSWQDLRVTNASGVLKSGTTFSHWIENDKTAWVKIPVLANDVNTTMYLNYGAPSMVAESSGTNVFEFFDDFDDGGYTDKWDANTLNGASIIQTSGIIEMTAGSATHSGAGVTSKNTISSGDWIIETQGKRDAGYRGGEPGLVFGFTDKSSQDTTYYGLWSRRADGGLYQYNGNSWRLSSYYDDEYSMGSTSLEIWDAKWSRATVTYLHADKKTKTRFVYGSTDTTIGPTAAGTNQLSSLYLQIHYAEYGQSGEKSYSDWVAVRKYASSEPVNTMYGEETRPSPVLPFRISISSHLKFAGSGFGFKIGGSAVPSIWGGYISVCGNGIIERPREECDGVEFEGETCVTQGCGSGTIQCDNCMIDLSACSGCP